MQMVYVLLPLSILLALGGFAAWLWAWRGGQFDDLDSPAVRVLFDEGKQVSKTEIQKADVRTQNRSAQNRSAQNRSAQNRRAGT